MTIDIGCRESSATVALNRYYQGRISTAGHDQGWGRADGEGLATRVAPSIKCADGALIDICGELAKGETYGKADDAIATVAPVSLKVFCVQRSKSAVLNEATLNFLNSASEGSVKRLANNL